MPYRSSLSDVRLRVVVGPLWCAGGSVSLSLPRAGRKSGAGPAGAAQSQFLRQRSPLPPLTPIKSTQDMAGICQGRLKAERKAWRKDHPHGFIAKPQKKADGSSNLMTWDCKIPGKNGTAWAGARYSLRLEFPADYPAKAPKCVFDPVIYHPNVYGSGKVCLSLVDDTKGWKRESQCRKDEGKALRRRAPSPFPFPPRLPTSPADLFPRPPPNLTLNTPPQHPSRSSKSLSAFKSFLTTQTTRTRRSTSRRRTSRRTRRCTIGRWV